MFLTYSQKNTISLQKSYTKILYISTALDQSFVTLATEIPGQSQIVVHIDKFGKELFAYKSEYPLNKMIMLDDRNVLVVEKQSNKIKKIDLLKKMVDSIPYLFSSNLSASLQLFQFSETSLLAIVQYNHFKQHYIIISYCHTFNIEIVFNQTFHMGIDEKTKFIYKSNNRSMIVWCAAIHLSTLNLSIFELRQQYQGGLRNIQIALPEHSLTNKSHYPNISILTIQQRDQQQLSIFCNTRIHLSQEDQQILINQEIVVNMMSLELQNNRLVFGDKNEQLIVTQVYFIGKASIYYTIQFSQTNFMTIKYYMDKRRTAFYIQPFQFNNKAHICFNDCRQQIVQWKWQKDKEVVQIESIKVIAMKELIMHFLLHLNEDFDDDILYDVIQLLDIE